jgi:hypothetical protein
MVATIGWVVISERPIIFQKGILSSLILSPGRKWGLFLIFSFTDLVALGSILVGNLILARE